MLQIQIKNIKMMSISELSNLNPIEQSSSSNSRILFKKCKQIIHQQMNQIKSLTRQLQSRSNEQINYKKTIHVQITQITSLQANITQLKTAIAQIKNQNQLLHKQLTVTRQQLEVKGITLVKKDNQIILIRNKYQLAEKTLTQLGLEIEQFKTKSTLLQDVNNMITYENQKLQHLLKQKNIQINQEIEEIRNVNTLLKRKHNIERMSIESPILNRYQHANRNTQSPLRTRVVQPYMIVTQPFASVQLQRKKCPQSTGLKQSNSSNLDHSFSKSFSSLKKKPLSTCLIRKNGTNPRQFSISKQPITKQPLITPKIYPSIHKRNPQMQEQLTNIKREILKQYNFVQGKRDRISNQRINQTLHNIQTKLTRLVKVTQYDESESQA